MTSLDVAAAMVSLGARCTEEINDLDLLASPEPVDPAGGLVCRYETSLVGLFHYDDADGVARGGAEVEIEVCGAGEVDLAWTTGARWLLWASDDIGKRAERTVDSIRDALSLDGPVRRCANLAEPSTSDTPVLRSEEEIYRANIEHHEFGAPITMSDDVIAIVENPRVVRRDMWGEDWVWVAVDLRLENRSSIPVGDLPHVDMVCAGSDETGGFSLTSPYDPYETLAAGAAIDTMVEMLPPGHGVAGVEPPVCESPAVVRVENWDFTGVGEPHDIALDQSILDEVNR